MLLILHLLLFPVATSELGFSKIISVKNGIEYTAELWHYKLFPSLLTFVKDDTGVHK